MVYDGKPYEQMDDLGTIIFGNTHKDPHLRSHPRPENRAAFMYSARKVSCAERPPGEAGEHGEPYGHPKRLR